MQPFKINTLGRNMFLYRDDKGTGIINKYEEKHFLNSNELEKRVIRNIKDHGVSLCSPLMCDIFDIDNYLLDGVDLRIRLDLAPLNFIVKSPDAKKKFKMITLTYSRRFYGATEEVNDVLLSSFL